MPPRKTQEETAGSSTTWLGRNLPGVLRSLTGGLLAIVVTILIGMAVFYTNFQIMERDVADLKLKVPALESRVTAVESEQNRLRQEIATTLKNIDGNLLEIKERLKTLETKN